MALAFLMPVAILMACGEDTTLGPVNAVEVTNSVDNFLFRVSNLENISDTRSYTWENTGTQATIDITQSIVGGSVILTIRDDAGTVVHQEDIADDNDTDTAVGVAGSWAIEVRLQNTTGGFDFRVQKKT